MISYHKPRAVGRPTLGKEMAICTNMSFKEFSEKYLNKPFTLSNVQRRFYDKFKKEFESGRRLIIPVPKRIGGL